MLSKWWFPSSGHDCPQIWSDLWMILISQSHPQTSLYGGFVLGAWWGVIAFCFLPKIQFSAWFCHYLSTCGSNYKFPSLLPFSYSSCLPSFSFISFSYYFIEFFLFFFPLPTFLPSFISSFLLLLFLFFPLIISTFPPCLHLTIPPSFFYFSVSFYCCFNFSLIFFLFLCSPLLSSLSHSSPPFLFSAPNMARFWTNNQGKTEIRSRLIIKNLISPRGRQMIQREIKGEEGQDPK